MNNENFTERESLEVITKMLQQTKQNIAGQNDGSFLIYGWSTVIISIAVYLLTTFTGNSLYAMLYLIMALIYAYRESRRKRHKPEMITFLDRSIEAVWQVMGLMFCLSYLLILGIGLLKPISSLSYAVMMPLCLLYAGLGTSITGILLRNKALVYTPALAFVVALYMLVGFINNWTFHSWWYLIFGASFLIMMVIPGYMINRSLIKSK